MKQKRGMPMEYGKVTAIVLAAGKGSRMGSQVPKQYLTLLGHEVLYYSLKAFEESIVDQVVLVTGAGDIDYCRSELVEKYGFSKVKKIIAGGAERYDSVYMGLKAAAPCDYVLIHDGARPMVTPEIISQVLEGAIACGSCTTAVPVKDTIKLSTAEGFAGGTPDRAQLRAVQTPQVFSLPLYRHALALAEEADKRYTDDCQLIEAAGGAVYLTMGDYRNIKITTPEDLLVAEAFAKDENQTGQ